MVWINRFLFGIPNPGRIYLCKPMYKTLMLMLSYNSKVGGRGPNRKADPCLEQIENDLEMQLKAFQLDTGFFR
jgi:hypothetical protein